MENIYEEDKNDVINICQKYGIKYTFFDRECNATGIGDILFYFLGIKNNIFSEPFYFNLNYFTKLYYEQNPINQLEFRIKLILDIIKFNNISSEMIKFGFSENYSLRQIRNTEYDLYSNFNLQINEDDKNIENTDDNM